MVEVFSDISKGLKKVFSPDKPKIINTSKSVDSLASDAAHGQFTFGVVYANDLAEAEMNKEKPNFPDGSIIVREKNANATSETPEIIIAMVKHEKDFSKQTGDWEFLVFNGEDLKLHSRETKSDCSKCHKQAEKTDWVFRDYLK